MEHKPAMISETFWAKIFMAGDINLAKNACSEFCMSGLCVNIYATEYIYTMGREAGFVVELINYPRFKESPEMIRVKAQALADFLLERCFQGSYTLMTPDTTVFISRRKDVENANDKDARLTARQT